MKRLILIAALPPILLLSACADAEQGSGGGSEPATIRGTVLLGPTCPVETAESACPPEPLADVRVQVLGTDGDVLATAVSGADGTFDLSVAPGSYLLQAVGEDAGRSAKPVRVTVGEGQELEVEVPVDSGIRAATG